LRFNLSHTRGLVACGVTTHHGIGVDVESHHRRLHFSDFAARHFSSLEVDSLKALPAEQRAERFFLYWTLKESYLKARGDGLRIPLNWIGFRVAPEGPIEASLDPRLLDDPRRWHFEVLAPTASHSLAVAVHRLCRGRITIEPWDGQIPT
jgi:4'-phosphopantetheinyl transferase